MIFFWLKKTDSLDVYLVLFLVCRKLSNIFFADIEIHMQGVYRLLL